MPLPGGAIDKFGNSYEFMWTVKCIINLMNEFFDYIHFEPPGEDGKGVEFYIGKNGNKEYHQVKSQNSKSGNFTNKKLEQMEVLQNFWNKLNMDENCKCVFVSMDSAYQLRKLSTRAKEATNFIEFKKYFIEDQNSQRWFSDLRHYWEDCREEIAYEALKRIEVKTIDNISLEEDIKNILLSIIVGEYNSIINCLHRFILENIHKKVTASDIWDYLYENGYERRELYKDTRMLTKLEKVNSRYLSRIERNFILDEQINKPEVDKIIELLEADNSSKIIVVTGEAGVGKSSVLYQTMNKLKKQNWIVLGFRIDSCKPVNTPEKLGEEIGITKESPVTILAAIANGKKCLLVIDQLDAVSEISGRNPQFYDECIEDIINQTKSYPNMHVLISCRKYDIDNDYRFKRLLDKNYKNLITVQPLSHDILFNILKNINVSIEQLNTKQIKLLLNPQHLKLFTIIKDKIGQNFKFKTSIDLYDEFWKEKKKNSRNRCSQRLKWEEMLEKIVKYMSDYRVLYIPENKLIGFEEEAKIMTSENVLIYENRKYFFFHEGFFDYAFARIFTSKENDLTEFLLNNKQYLFRRSQVRQVLLYERENEFEKYITDLRNLIENEKIRYHIKQVVFSILRVLENPTIQEWNIIQQYMDINSDYYNEIWKSINYSTGWFELLDKHGIIQNWLESNNEEYIEQLIIMFSNVYNLYSERIVDLIDKYINKSKKWNQRFVKLIQWTDVSCGRKYFEMYLKLIDLEIIDKLKYNLVKDKPDWACEAIQHYLNKKLEILKNQSNINFIKVLNQINGLDSDSVIEVAKKSPYKFIELILPIMIEIIELNLYKEYGAPYEDRIWSHRYINTYYNFKDALLVAMERAFCFLAKNDTIYYEKICKELRLCEYETIQYLLMKGYTANAQYFANQSIEYILQKPYRLKTGYVDNQYWVTRELLKEATKYCSYGIFLKIEKVIMNYYPEEEISIDAYKYKDFETGSPRGYAQFQLLYSICRDRMSKQAYKRYLELKRKFNKISLEKIKPRAFKAHWVRSPINEVSANKMTDIQWIKAVKKYKDDKYTKDVDGIPIGSAYQLSSILEKESKKNPERFVNLLYKFDDDVNIYYFNAILNGLRDNQVNVKKETIMKAILRCHNLPNKPCGRNISWLLKSYSKYKYPEKILDILKYYALEDLDPKEEMWNVRSPGGQYYHNRDPFSYGINSARGSAAEAIALLIYYHEEYLGYLKDQLIRMVNDKSIAVRSCVAKILLYLLNYNRNLAVDLFLKLCQVKEDKLLATPYVEEFIKYGIKTHYNELYPILNRMINSRDEEVQRVGARQACLALLSNCNVEKMVEICLKGSKSQQIGVAEVFSVNIRNKDLRKTCEDYLLLVLESDYKEVRQIAANCFSKIQGNDLNDYWDFVLKYVKTKGFKENVTFLLSALREINDVKHEIVFQICSLLIDLVEKENINYSKGYYYGETLSKLIMKIYRQAADEKIKEKSLDIIDNMMKKEVYGIHKIISEDER